MKARILWVAGKRVDGPEFVPILRKKGYLVETVSTGAAALEHLKKGYADLIVLEIASLRTSGKRILHSISEVSNGAPVLVITNADHPKTADLEANVVLPLPFTSRKLLNRMLPLLPIENASLLHAGPLRLDVEHRQLYCQGREAKLTPRLVALLQVFMKHPKEVQKRNELFREVWTTEYTEDTRTLDVHMSWLRQALEEDPRNPKFLITVRGVGYRLDVD